MELKFKDATDISTKSCSLESRLGGCPVPSAGPPAWMQTGCNYRRVVGACDSRTWMKHFEDNFGWAEGYFTYNTFELGEHHTCSSLWFWKYITFYFYTISNAEITKPSGLFHLHLQCTWKGWDAVVISRRLLSRSWPWLPTLQTQQHVKHSHVCCQITENSRGTGVNWLTKMRKQVKSLNCQINN